MATLADELQNDFLSSGEEERDAEENSADEDAAWDQEAQENGRAGNVDEDVEMDDGMLGEAEEETEARLQAQKKSEIVGKDLGGVAKFMKGMEPILEVSLHSRNGNEPNVFTCCTTDLTCSM